MPSDSDRILSSGVPVDIGGREVHLRYTMRSLKQLEDTFGDLDAADGALTGGKIIGGMLSWLAAGLLHEGLSEEELLDQLDPSRPSLKRYATAIREAAAQALGDAKEEENPKGKRPKSTGRAGTTRPPLSSVEATGTSGI